MGIGYLPTWKFAMYRRFDVALAEVRKRVEPAEYQRRLLAGHPYVLYSLGMPIDSPADMRVTSEEGLSEAPAGTILVTGEYLWKIDGKPGDGKLESWGYREDVRILGMTDAVRPYLPWLSFEYEASRVHVWVKEEGGEE